MANILAIRFSALGDVAMTVPVIFSIAEHYPMHQITILSRKNVAPLFENLPSNVHFKGIDPKNYKGLGGLIRLYKELKAERKYDAVADLHDVLRSKILRTLFRWGGTPVAAIHKDRKARKALTRKEKKALIPLKSSPERYADVFATLGMPVNISIRSLWGNNRPQLTQEIKDITGNHNGVHWIGVAPFAAHKGKIYPLDKMKEVLRLLNAQPNTKIFLFGFGKEEQEWCQQCDNEMSNVKSLVAQLGLQKELLLMSHLDVMLTMDSGNMHLASITNTPVVSIWGATHPYAGFTGLQPKGSQRVEIELPCRPCSIFGNKPCYKSTYECMYNIKPETVVDAIVSACTRKEETNE